MSLCKHPEEVCGSMTICDGKAYCDDNIVGFCHLHDKPLPQTNADHIRSMTDEELMGFLFNEVSCGSICEFCVPVPRKSTKCDGHCRNGILSWLKQPYKEETK